MDRIVAPKLSPQPGKLVVELGGGEHPRFGGLNVDRRRLPTVDRVCDLGTEPLPFAPGSVDAVYSFHVLDQIPRHRLPALIADIYRVLRSGGETRHAGPDFGVLAYWYSQGWLCECADPYLCMGRSNCPQCGGGARITWSKLCDCILSRQSYEGDFKRNLITTRRLQEMMREAGFASVRERGQWGEPFCYDVWGVK